MSFLNKVKTNEVKFGLENYVFLIRSAPKLGKTSLYASLVKEMYGDITKGLLIPFEKGYSAINDVNVFPHTITPEMVIDDESYTGWEVFTGLVDELCNQDHIKFIAIDTVDEFINVASEEVCRLSRIKTKKPCDSIDSSFGGFARGKKYLANMIKEQIEKLRGNGIGIMFIGHTKVKTLKTKIDEQEYQIMGSNLTEDYDRIFANDADFIMMISEDTNIVNGKLISGERFLRLRGDGFYSAGCRFHNVPERISLDAKVLINTIKTAVMELNNVKDETQYKEKVKEENIIKEKEIAHNKEIEKDMAVELMGKIKAFGSNPNVATSVKEELVQACLSAELDMKEPTNNKLSALRDIVDRFKL